MLTVNRVGFLVMIVPLYQAELAHPSIRGRITSLQQFMLGVGSLCAAWISYGTYVGFSGTNNAQWQVSLGLQVVPAVFLGALIMFFPEVCSNEKYSINHLCRRRFPDLRANTDGPFVVTPLAYRPWTP